jgi:hypothetical protein
MRAALGRMGARSVMRQNGAVMKLRKDFKTWPPTHFRQLSEPDIEHYYPTKFREDAKRVLALEDENVYMDQKTQLFSAVLEWLREDAARGRAALAESAAEVIGLIKEIEAVVTSTDRSAAPRAIPTNP